MSQASPLVGIPVTDTTDEVRRCRISLLMLFFTLLSGVVCSASLTFLMSTVESVPSSGCAGTWYWLLFTCIFSWNSTWVGIAICIVSGKSCFIYYNTNSKKRAYSRLLWIGGGSFGATFGLATFGFWSFTWPDHMEKFAYDVPAYLNVSSACQTLHHFGFVWTVGGTLVLALNLMFFVIAFIMLVLKRRAPANAVGNGVPIATAVAVEASDEKAGAPYVLVPDC